MSPSKKKQCGNGKSLFLIGDTSSNGFFFLARLVFGIASFACGGWLYRVISVVKKVRDGSKRRQLSKVTKGELLKGYC